MKWHMDWSDAVNPDRVELVFANRNKEYGAYEIRTKYQTRVVRALIIALSGITLAVAIPILVNYLSHVNFGKKEKMVEEITLAEPPPIDKTAPPPPPVIPPPPVQQTIKFTPPKVVKDEEVQEPPPTQEETKEVQVSTETHEGEKIADLPPENPVVEDEGKIFTIVEEMPSFPGGEAKMLEYVAKNIKYPPMARENNITGRVYINFYIDKDGKVQNAKVVRGISPDCDQEALRVVRSMPQWTPGKQNGRAVNVNYNLPINFTLK
jgi:protein TonB